MYTTIENFRNYSCQDKHDKSLMYHKFVIKVRLCFDYHLYNKRNTVSSFHNNMLHFFFQIGWSARPEDHVL